jgi:nucleoside-diphosphate-sugar epimerase
VKNNISILGCGWLGFPLALTLTKKGYSIKGSITSEIKVEKLKSNGVQPFIINLSNRENEFEKFLNSEVLIIAIPSKNIADFKNLISHIENSKIKTILFISSTSVYPNSNSIVTENSLIKKNPLSEIELLFKTNTNFKSTILRFGGLIGYDRKPGNFFKNGKAINYPDAFVNLIHRDDCIQIIKEIIAKNIWDKTLNACADTHPKKRDFYAKEFKKEGRNNPTFNELASNEYKIINSDQLKSILNYNFLYSDLMHY